MAEASSPARLIDMRDLSIIVGLLLLAVLTSWAAFDFFAANEGIHYFRHHPHNLVYVAAAGLVGAVLALTFGRLTADARRQWRLLALGALATCVTGLAGFAAVVGIQSLQLLPVLTETGTLGLYVSAFVAPFVMSGVLWWEFYRVWSRSVPDNEPFSNPLE